MQLHCPALNCLVPDGVDVSVASQRTTHMGIGAHPDDLEIIAISGILACINSSQHWFTGVVACDGAGSPRSGDYADLSDSDMVETRRQEQRRAAALGRYSLQLQLGFKSRDADSLPLVDCLEQVLRDCRPETLFIHNPADAHATHRALARSSLAALSRLPVAERPGQVWGVEVWRSLDWLEPPRRVALAVDDPDGLQARLLRCHDSQVSGGKRYDEAIIARQRANATLVESHGVDACGACVLAMDLGPLLGQPQPDLDAYLLDLLSDFRDSILG